MGRFGTLLSVQHTSGTDSEESIETVTKGLCQHIIASSPLSIGNPADKPSTNTQEETRLLFQEYALDEEVTVKEILDENDLTVTDFIRFECGELLLEEKDWIIFLLIILLSLELFLWIVTEHQEWIMRFLVICPLTIMRVLILMYIIQLSLVHVLNW